MNNILVVDNNPMMLEFMQVVLQEEGYKVYAFETAIEVLDFVKRARPEEIPDIFFVDLVMPQIGGIQLCRLLRRSKKLLQSHIVIVSAIAAEEEGLNFSELADAYLAKMPFKPMKGHILTLLKDFSEGRIDGYRGRIIGADKIYKRDITRELLFSKQHMERLLAGITDAFFEIGPREKIVFVNKAAAELFEKEVDELLNLPFPSLFPKNLRPLIRDALEQARDHQVILGEKEALEKIMNRYLKLKFNEVSYNDYHSTVVLIQDISAHVRAEEIIRNDLKEKETLLKEVHHRVKNNLNVVASLLNLQTLYLTDETSKKHLMNSKSRVESMALIHEKLYDTEDFKGVYLDSYITDLVSQLVDIYNISEIPVSTRFDIPDLHIDLNFAVPLGLMVNEIITNSLEHGLKNSSAGKIEVRFYEDDGTYCFSIKDNGIGLPEDFSIESTESLGLLLVSNLAQQINATFELRNENGVNAVICIDKESDIFKK
jgi:PAS domain S-box-containing protein